MASGPKLQTKAFLRKLFSFRGGVIVLEYAILIGLIVIGARFAIQAFSGG